MVLVEEGRSRDGFELVNELWVKLGRSLSFAFFLASEKQVL